MTCCNWLQTWVESCPYYLKLRLQGLKSKRLTDTNSRLDFKDISLANSDSRLNFKDLRLACTDSRFDFKDLRLAHMAQSLTLRTSKTCPYWLEAWLQGFKICPYWFKTRLQGLTTCPQWLKARLTKDLLDTWHQTSRVTTIVTEVSVTNFWVFVTNNEVTLTFATSLHLDCWKT